MFKVLGAAYRQILYFLLEPQNLRLRPQLRSITVGFLDFLEIGRRGQRPTFSA